MRLIILLPILLAGCQYVPGTDAAAIREAEKAIKAELSDPDSAQFRNERVLAPRKDIVVARDGKLLAEAVLVCGEVNARTPMGGYAGFTSFAYEGPPSPKAHVYPMAIASNDDAFAILHFPERCATKKPAEPPISQEYSDRLDAEAMALGNDD